MFVCVEVLLRLEKNDCQIRKLMANISSVSTIMMLDALEKSCAVHNPSDAL